MTIKCHGVCNIICMDMLGYACLASLNGMSGYGTIMSEYAL